ncbi:MAG TPA: HAD-IIB family hydrolase [Bacillota bacterium]|nr:HAD-IIB family hydrolase [Bacillota bacterium]
MKNYIREHKYFIILMSAVTLIATVPLLYFTTMRGHDIFFHLQRIDALADEFKMGNFFPYLYSTLLNGCGYASPMFYGDLFLSIPALLVVAGMSVTGAYTAFQIIIMYSCALTTYFSVKSMMKSKRGAFCAAMMFALSSYLCTDMFHRAALGEAQAFVFLPVVFLGYYHIMYGDRDKWFWLPIGMACMLACHTLTSVMTAVVLVVMTVCLAGRIIQKPIRLLWLGIGAAVFFLLGTDFIFPLLEQMKSTTFLATDGYASTKWGELIERALPGWALIYDFNTSAETSWWIPNGIGLALPALALMYAAIWKKYRDRLGMFMLAFSVVLLFLTSIFFPWDVIQDYVGVIQFPWRILVFVTFFLAMSASRLIAKAKMQGAVKYLTIAVVGLSLFSYFACYAPIYDRFMGYKENGDPEYDYNENIGAAEYLPTSDAFTRNNTYSSKYASAIRGSADKVYSDGSLRAAFTRENGILTVRFSGSQKESAYIDVPLVMYKGYTAFLDDGTELECTYGVYNRIRVYIDTHTEGTITFEYTGTTVQHISRAVSFITFNGLLLYLILRALTKKKRRAKTLYATDLDGTLFDADSQIPPQALARLNEEISDGKNILIATARTPATLHEKLRGLDIKLPCIIMNGSAIYDLTTDKYIRINPIDRTSAALLARAGDSIPGALLYTVENDVLTAYYKGSTGEVMDNYIEQRRGDYKNFILTDSLEETFKDKELIDFVVLSREEDVKRSYDMIKNIPLINSWYCSTFTKDYSFIEANASYASKAAMARLVMKQYSFTKLVAFGDSLNDLSLITEADFSAVPDNADIALKGRASIVLAGNADGSIVQFICDNDL